MKYDNKFTKANDIENLEQTTHDGRRQSGINGISNSQKQII